MKHGADNKRTEEASVWGKWGKSIANVFKPKKELEKHEPAGPSINPEALTAQKREWIDSQAAQVQQSLATWPEHLFEHFFVVGLPPDIEVTQIAEDLWAQELKQRQPAGDAPPPPPSGGGAGPAPASGASAAASRGGVPPGARPGHQAYDKAPRPAYDARVLFRHPASKPAPLSDQELVDLCFPHRVTPVRLRRSPSMSSLHEVVYGRNAAARDEQCFIFLLKVGTSLPLYGICCAVPEVLHRPPHLARHLYPSCRMPFRSVMIAAPRVYCLLSHYPFFDLHFQVLNVILGMERLHRTIDFNSELDGGVSGAGGAGSGGGAGGPGGGGAAAAAGARGTTAGAATAKAQQQPQLNPQQKLRHPSSGGVLASSRCYCHDCATAIADMYPGLLQPPREAGALLRPSRSGRPTFTNRLLDDLAKLGAAPAAGRDGSPLDVVMAAAGGAAVPSIRTHGSVRRLSDPGSSGHRSPCLADRDSALEPNPATAADLRLASKLLSNGGGVARISGGAPSGGGGGGEGGGGAAVAVGLHSPAGWPGSDVASPIPAGSNSQVANQFCQACGRALLGPGHPHPGDRATVQEQEQDHTPGLLTEATGALESALDKLSLLPRAVAASVTEAAAAAAVVLRRVSPGPGVGTTTSSGGSAAADGADSNGAVGGLQVMISSVVLADTDGKATYPHSDSYLSSDMGTPHGALPGSSPPLTARHLVAAPAEAVSSLALRVRDSLKAFGSNGGRRHRRSLEGTAAGKDSSDGGGAAATADADATPAGGSRPEQPDGLHINRLGPDQRAFINANHVPPLFGRQTAFPRLNYGGGAPGSGDGVQAAAAAAAAASPVSLPTWHSSTATVGAGLEGLGPDPGSISLVQQLMRSVMAPMSPSQVEAALAASEAFDALRPSLDVQSSVHSPQLPASPKHEPPSQQLDPVSRSVAPEGTQLAGGPQHQSSGPGPSGHSASWFSLNRLSRRSPSPLPTAGASSGLEKHEQWAGGPMGQLGPAGPGGRGGTAPPAAANGAVVAAQSPCLASPFATAVDLAATVEQQIAAPRTPAVDENAAWAAVSPQPVRGPTPAGQAAEGGRSEPPELPSRDHVAGGPRCEAASSGASPETAAAKRPRATGSPGGGPSSETASVYASLPPSVPHSRRVTAGGDGGLLCRSGDGREDSESAGGGGGGGGPGASGECAAKPPPPPRRPPPPVAAAAALLAAAPRLVAEFSGLSAIASEASFYSAEGPEDDCTPSGDAAAAAAAATDEPSPFWDAQQAGAGPQAAFALSAPSTNITSRADGGRVQGRRGGGGDDDDDNGSAELSSSQPEGAASAGGRPTGPHARGASSLPLAPVASHPQRPMSHGPSRLGRGSASLEVCGGGGGGAGAGGAPAHIPLRPQLASSATSWAPHQVPLRSRSAGGAEGGGGGAAAAAAAASAAALPTAPSAAAALVSCQLSSGVASPPPPGVAVTGDMAHHFSPRHALDQLYNHPRVHPGEQITLRFGGVATLQFSRPLLARRYTVVGHPRAIQAYAEAELAEGLQHWTTAVLCRSLSLENLLMVLTAVLLERQVVVFCPHISVLSCCVLGVLPLLRPFGWQSLLLPVTPVSMMGFLEAPVPFVLGVQYKTSDVMARCSHLIRVNVYKDQVKNAGAPLPQLPGLKRLTAALAPHHALLRRRLLAGGGGGGHAGGPAFGGGGHAGGAGPAAAGSALGMLLAGHHPDAPLDGGRSLRSLSPAELSATGSFLTILAQHLGSVCGDLRPHVITNVGMSKRTGVLMKETLLEVAPSKDRPFVRQFVETQMFSVWSDALISSLFEGSFAAS